MSRHTILLLLGFLLGSINAVASIDCVQCTDCSDATKLPKAEECKTNTMLTEVAKLTLKIKGSDAAKADLPLPIGGCYKIDGTLNNKATTSRGCGSEGKTTCNKKDGVEVCLCSGNGCNTAPKSLVPSAISTFVLTSFVFMVTYV